MTTPKKRGTNFEYKTAYIFESFGFSWDRSGSSLGIDLKISKKGRLQCLISCKKTSTLQPIYLPKEEMDRLRTSVQETGAKGMVCFGFRRTPVLAINLNGLNGLEETRLYYKLTPDKGKPLKELLSNGDIF